MANGEGSGNPFLQQPVLLPQNVPAAPENRFFPDSSVVSLSNVLGLLDLTLGAPARGVQAVAIGALRNEPIGEILGQTGRNILGFGDQGFGQGEIVSGLSLLEELGLVKDRENFGNLIAGAGVDFATDLVAFNVLGAARRLVGGGRGVADLLTADVRLRPFRPPVVKATTGESRLLKERVISRLSSRQLGSLVRQLEGFVEVGPLRPDRLDKIRDSLLRMSDRFDFEDLHVRVERSPERVQNLLLNPTGAQLGQAATALERGRFGFLDDFAPEEIRVVDFKVGKYLGSNRPSNFFDVRFPDFDIRKRAPANQLQPGYTDLVLKGKAARPGVLQSLIPAWMNPIDHRNLLRRTGIMNPVVTRLSRLQLAIRDDFAELDALAKEIGLSARTDRARRLGLAIENRDIYNALTDQERLFLQKVDAFEKSIAARVTEDGKRLLPEEFFVPNYFHHRRTDIRQPVMRHFEVELEEGWRLNFARDIPDHLKVGFTMKRWEDSKNLDYDIIESVKAYIISADRKLHLEPLAKEIGPDLRALNQRGTANLYNSARHAVSSAFGHYGEMDAWFDDLVERIGLPPWASAATGNVVSREHYANATRLSVAINAMTMRAALGLSPRTSILQFFQLAVNNTMELGYWDALKGFFRQVNPSGRPIPRAQFKEMPLWNGFMRSLDQDFAPLFGKQRRFMDRVDKVLFSGIGAVDNLNRGSAFWGAYGLAKRNGLSDEAAKLLGIKAANETQFIYGKLATSSARLNPLGRVLLQFQSYAFKQLSFITQKFRNDPGTAFLRFVGMTGMISRSWGKAISVERDLVPMTPGDALNLVNMQNWDQLAIGEQVGAFVDFAKVGLQQTLGVPKSGMVMSPEMATEQLLRTVMRYMVPAGAVVDRMARFAPTAFAPETLPPDAPEGLARAYELARKAFAGIGMTEGEKKFLLTRTGAVGAEVDKYGRKIKGLSQSEAALAMVGFRASDSRMQRDVIANLRYEIERVNARRSALLSEAVRAVMNGRPPNTFLIQAAQVSGASLSAVMQAFQQRIRNRPLTLRQRLLERRQPILERRGVGL